MLIHSSVFNSAASWTIAHQAPLPMEFSREEYWSGVPLPSPGDLPNPGIKHRSLASPALTGGFFTTSATWEAPHKRVCVCMCSVTHSCLTLCNPMDWIVAHQAPLPMKFSRKEYWTGLPFPSPGDVPNPEIEHRSPALQVDSLPSEPPGKPLQEGRRLQTWMISKGKLSYHSWSPHICTRS